MIEAIDKILNVGPERISVKATTNERLRLCRSERGHCCNSHSNRLLWHGDVMAKRSRRAINSAARDVIEAYASAGKMIATAESCTGGMIAAALTDIAGSSVVFERGFVTYSNQAKIEQLGVSIDTLREHGAVSLQTAAEMAQGAVRHSKADIAVSVTGIAVRVVERPRNLSDWSTSALPARTARLSI